MKLILLAALFIIIIGSAIGLHHTFEKDRLEQINQTNQKIDSISEDVSKEITSKMKEFLDEEKRRLEKNLESQ